MSGVMGVVREGIATFRYLCDEFRSSDFGSSLLTDYEVPETEDHGVNWNRLKVVPITEEEAQAKDSNKNAENNNEGQSEGASKKDNVRELNVYWPTGDCFKPRTNVQAVLDAVKVCGLVRYYFLAQMVSQGVHFGSEVYATATGGPVKKRIGVVGGRLFLSWIGYSLSLDCLMPSFLNFVPGFPNVRFYDWPVTTAATYVALAFFAVRPRSVPVALQAIGELMCDEFEYTVEQDSVEEKSGSISSSSADNSKKASRKAKKKATQAAKARLDKKKATQAAGASDGKSSNRPNRGDSTTTSSSVDDPKKASGEDKEKATQAAGASDEESSNRSDRGDSTTTSSGVDDSRKASRKDLLHRVLMTLKKLAANIKEKTTQAAQSASNGGQLTKRKLKVLTSDEIRRLDLRPLVLAFHKGQVPPGAFFGLGRVGTIDMDFEVKSRAPLNQNGGQQGNSATAHSSVPTSSAATRPVTQAGECSGSGSDGGSYSDSTDGSYSDSTSGALDSSFSGSTSSEEDS